MSRELAIIITLVAYKALLVVFGVIADPVAARVMEDLTQPGGNMTGVKLGQRHDRRLELLLEIAPGTRRVFVPFNPDDSAAATAVDQIHAVAGDLQPPAALQVAGALRQRRLPDLRPQLVEQAAQHQRQLDRARTLPPVGHHRLVRRW